MLTFAAALLSAPPAFPSDQPGCAMGVETGGRRDVFASGLADLEHGAPISADTVFEAGSVAKQFTAAAILLLAADGKLALDDDIRKFLPEMPDYGAPITVQHLLSHTSGLRDWGALMAAAGWDRGTRVYTQADVLDIARRQRSLNHSPGTDYSYTNTGYNLLALIVERASGRSFQAFTAERLFAPLGMGATRWRDDFRAVVPGRAMAYGPGPAFAQAMPFENGFGNGGLLTTVGDLLRWNAALDRRALGAEVTRQLSEPSRLKSGAPLLYARGLYARRYAGTAEISHEGSTGGYRAWLGRFPDKGVSIAVLCNRADADTVAIAHALAAPRIAPPPAAPPGSPRPEAAGVYLDEGAGAVIDLVWRDGLAVRRGPRLQPLGADRFALEGGEVRVTGPGRLDVLGAEGLTRVYVRQPPFAPADLASYTGRFRNDEIGVDYVISVRDGVLELAIDRAPAQRFRLEPVYADAFRAGAMVVRFERRDGRPAALSVSRPRLRDLRFVRSPEPPAA